MTVGRALYVVGAAIIVADVVCMIALAAVLTGHLP